MTVPSSWNELSKSDFLWIVSKMKHLNQLEDPNAYENEFWATKILLINRLIKKILPARLSYRVTSYQYADLLPITDFLKDPINIDKQHIPSFRIWWRKYYGPTPGLRQSTFGEFINADTYFINISKKKDPDLIFKLIAVLYRPKQRLIWFKKLRQTWNGDIRADFNESMVESTAKHFKRHLSPEMAEAILFFYWGFRNVHVLKFENIFDEPQNENHAIRVGNSYGWAGTLLELSGDKFGNIEETRNANWFSVFVEMSRQIDIAKSKE